MEGGKRMRNDPEGWWSMSDLDLEAIKARTSVEWVDDDGEVEQLVCLGPEERDTLVAEVERLRVALKVAPDDGEWGQIAALLTSQSLPMDMQPMRERLVRKVRALRAALHPEEHNR